MRLGVVSKHQHLNRLRQIKGSFRSLFLLGVLISCSAWAKADECDVDPARINIVSGYQLVHVQAVYDGDTVLLADGRKVRVVGINTPEVAHGDQVTEPIANQAHKALQALIGGKHVILKVGGDTKDHYGRTLAHLFDYQGKNITRELLLQGLGFQVAFPPNLWGVACYQASELVAKKHHLGVWKDPYFQPVEATSQHLKGGFGRVTGAVERLYVGKKRIWIDLEGDVSIRIEKKDSQHLKGEVLKRLLDAHEHKKIAELPALQIRGWLVDRTAWGKKMASRIKRGERKRWQLNLRHQIAWHFVE